MISHAHGQPSAGSPPRPALLSMLEARSVALVGASARPGSFGSRMLAEAAKSAARPEIYPVNPRYHELDGRQCYPSLTDLPGPADLVLLGVPDAVLEQQLTLAAERGCKSAVIFSNAHEETLPSRPSLRDRLAAVARSAGMELCGAGCMGFANVSYGLRAMGYVEPDPLPAGPVALVTHSGSVFSTLLRTRRGLGFTLAVSSGQELVTAAPSYLSYALELPETKVLALVVEAIRQPEALRGVLGLAAERDIPIVLLAAGRSASGRAMVAAHSGALAGSDGGWEALSRAYGIHRVGDLAELADTLELFSLQASRIRRTGGQRRMRAAGLAASAHEAAATRGIATVHDSGLERAHAADMADELGIPFAAISTTTKARLEPLLDPGLLPANPLDVWGTGSGTRELFGSCLVALAADDAVDAVALAVDLVAELDDDESYRLAALDAARQTDKPLVVLSNLASGIDPAAAAALRAAGIPVLEGMRPGLQALGHLLDHGDRDPASTSAPGGHGAIRPSPAGPNEVRSGRVGRARRLLAEAGQTGTAQLELVREYGIATARCRRVSSAAQAVDAADQIGYPVVLKTDEPGVAHKSDIGGVLLGIGSPDELAALYADLAASIGPAALVCETVSAGTELALGIVSDPDLGPLVVVGAGGILVELITDRAVALPPCTEEQALELIGELRVKPVLDGARGAPRADLGAIARAISGLGDLACELAPYISALDINPLICGPRGAVAVDALVVPR